MNTIKVPPRRRCICGKIALGYLYNVRVPDFHLQEGTPDGSKVWRFTRYDKIVLSDGALLPVAGENKMPNTLNGELGHLISHLPSALPPGLPDILRKNLTPERQHYFVRSLPVNQNDLHRFLDAFACRDAVTLFPSARPFVTPQKRFISGHLHLLVEFDTTPLMSDVSVIGWAGVRTFQEGDHLQVYSTDGKKVLWSETLTSQLINQLEASFAEPERDMPDVVQSLNKLFREEAPAILEKAA